MQIIFSTKRLWIITIIAITGITIAYTAILFRTPSTFSSQYVCPANCNGDNCLMHDTCNNGRCSDDCPGNCIKTHDLDSL